MQLQLLFHPGPTREHPRDQIIINGTAVPLRWVRHPRARRYVLRLGRDGAVRVTIPRRGSQAEARRVAHRHRQWIERQLTKQREEAGRDQSWRHGSEFLYRGERVRLLVEPGQTMCFIRFATISIAVEKSAEDLRPIVERHLWRLARAELPHRALALAAKHGFQVRSVTVRNQRSRWGSCSRRGTLSLNWRLLQMPPDVCDYIILHELAHLRVMNHSRKYWRVVADLCPGFRSAESWLKSHGRELQMGAA